MSATKTAPNVESADDCGCNAGALSASLALILYLIVAGLVPWLRAQPGRLTWIGSVIVVLGSGIAGKVLGMRR